MIKNIFLAFLFYSLNAFAWKYTLSAGARTYVPSASVEVIISHDGYLWNKSTAKEFWNYGYWKIYSTIAAHGLLEAGLTLSPISILEFGFAQSTTSRFYESKVYDCTNYFCKGNVQRSKFNFKLGLGYEKMYLLNSYQKISTIIGSISQLAADESENILFNPTGDTLEINTFVVGYKYTEKLSFNLALKTAKFANTQQNNLSQYILSSWKEDNTEYGLGLGQYESTVSTIGLSAVGYYRWNWGNGLGLF